MSRTSDDYLSYEQILDYLIDNLQLVKPFVLKDVAEIYGNVHGHFIGIRIDITYSKFHVLYFGDDNHSVTLNIDVFKKFIKKNNRYYYITAPAKRSLFESNINEELFDIPQSNDEWFNLLMMDNLSKDYFLKFKKIILHCEKLLGFA